MTNLPDDGGTMTVTTGPGSYRDRVRSGWITAALLAVLTLMEYAIAVTVDNPLILLLPFVVAKGALIMDFFMHVRKLQTGGEHA
jgi:cytochrome c oxidase subunit IV